jgi:nitrate reductase assembly molybdenum cofactor insertion protein NarJ
MRASVDIHDRIADLLGYPSAGGAARVLAIASDVASFEPGLAEALRPLIELAGTGRTGELEESYAAAFDNNAERALEVGWHAFGENYTRGAFLVRMRERLREHGIQETSELPDHLSHVLRVLGRAEERQATLLTEAIVLPAVEKMLAAAPKADPWRGAVEAARELLKTHLAAGEPAHA